MNPTNQSEVTFVLRKSDVFLQRIAYEEFIT